MQKKWKGKLLRLQKWLKTNIFTREMILPVICGELLFWSPLIVTGFMALFINSWWWTAFSSIYFIWVFLCPAIPTQLLFIAGFKWLFKHFRRLKISPVSIEGFEAYIEDSTTQQNSI